MSEKHRYGLGIDFGGTSTKMGLVNDHGAILARASFATAEASGREAWFRAVEKGLAEVQAAAGDLSGHLAGIGVGVPGFVDYERGFIHDLTNVPGWREVPLADLLRERFSLPAFVDNDVNVMAVGECTFGAGRLYQHAVFLTLGTGVGGALLINNKLYRGAYSMAGELGHISIDLHGAASPQGRGGLEQYVGNRKIVERVVAELEGGRESLVRELVHGRLEDVTPKVVAAAAEKGDALALEIFDYVADCLAAAFASVTYLLQPQAFIIGGGVGQSGEVLFAPLRRHLAERLSPFFAEHIELVAAELGNDAGIIGGATLALMSA